MSSPDLLSSPDLRRIDIAMKDGEGFPAFAKKLLIHQSNVGGDFVSAYNGVDLIATSESTIPELQLMYTTALLQVSK